MPTPLLQTPIPQSSKTGLLKRPRRRRVGTQLETSSEQARVGYAGGGGREWFFSCSSRKWRRRRRKRGRDGEERHGTGIQYSSRPYKGSSTREIHPLSPPHFFLCVCLSFPLFLALAHKPVFCTNPVRNLYAITIPLLLLPLLCKRAIAGATKEQGAAAAATTEAESHHQNLEQRRT